MLIVLDGIDGTGKSTHVAQLAEWLRERGHDVLTSREPTSGPWGQKLIDSATTGRLSAEDELDLFIKDRQQHVAELIQPALEANQTVILDRYYFSTIAYQGCRGLDPDDIRQRNEAFAPIPDHLFILDLGINTALTRIGSRGDTANAFERRESLTCCREIFLSFADEPYAHLIDASPPLDAVQSNIRHHLTES